MDEATIIHAVERIEAALARLDKAARDAARNGKDLRRRHDALRQTVSGSLADLDTLIAQAAAAKGAS